MTTGADDLGAGLPDAPGTDPYAGNVSVGSGDPRIPALPALTSAQVATANATDLATSQALANALKAAHNQVQADLAALRATIAGLLVTTQPGQDEGQASVTGRPTSTGTGVGGSGPGRPDA